MMATAILLSQLSVSDEDDPFEEFDDNSDSDLVDIDGELADLIRGVQGDAEHCSPLELISAKSDLSVCSEFADETWEDEFMDSLGPNSKIPSIDSDSDPEEDTTDKEEPVPRIKTFHEAITTIEDVRTFLESKGYTSEANVTDTLINSVVRLQCSVANVSVQTSLITFRECKLSIMHYIHMYKNLLIFVTLVLIISMYMYLRI